MAKVPARPEKSLALGKQVSKGALQNYLGVLSAMAMDSTFLKPRASRGNAREQAIRFIEIMFDVIPAQTHSMCRSHML